MLPPKRVLLSVSSVLCTLIQYEYKTLQMKVILLLLYHTADETERKSVFMTVCTRALHYQRIARKAHGYT